MYKLFLVTLLLMLNLSVSAQEFSVDRIFVESEYNSRYILTYANKIIPLNEEISSKRVDCLLENLNESKMFEQIKTEMVPTNKKNVYSMILKPIYKNDPRTFLIQEIVVNESLGIREDVLLNRLKLTNITVGKHFMPYNEIEFSIIEATEDLEDSMKDTSISKKLWIKAFLINDNSIRLEIGGLQPACADFSDKQN